eukprot:scaffold7368_cov143-Isochrysis_galbana.AAC.6
MYSAEAVDDSGQHQCRLGGDCSEGREREGNRHPNRGSGNCNLCRNDSQATAPCTFEPQREVEWRGRGFLRGGDRRNVGGDVRSCS